MPTITVGQNSYVTEAELQTYADNRGITISASDPTILLIQAMDYMETRSYKGNKTDESQDLEWPREKVFVNGEELADDTVPERIKQAQMTAALIYDEGGDLLGSVGQRVLSQTVEGAVSVTYSEQGQQTQVYPKMTALLKDYLAGGTGSSFTVTRA